MKTCLIDGLWSGRIVEDDGRVEYRFPLPSQVALAADIEREGQGRLHIEIYECRYIRKQFTPGLFLYIDSYADTRNVWAILQRQIQSHIEAMGELEAKAHEWHDLLIRTAEAVYGRPIALIPGAIATLPEVVQKLEFERVKP